jgi:hypothetical protein
MSMRLLMATAFTIFPTLFFSFALYRFVGGIDWRRKPLLVEAAANLGLTVSVVIILIVAAFWSTRIDMPPVPTIDYARMSGFVWLGLIFTCAGIASAEYFSKNKRPYSRSIT